MLEIVFILIVFCCLVLWFREFKHKQIHDETLRLHLPIIMEDIEQIIERTGTMVGEKLIFDSRYCRFLKSNSNNSSHIVRFPIMLPRKINTEEQRYIQEVFFTQFPKGFNSKYQNWSDKGHKLCVSPHFTDIVRYNNQYYLELVIHFTYKGD